MSKINYITVPTKNGDQSAEISGAGIVKNVLVRLADGREMVYPADAIKVTRAGGLIVAVSLLRCEKCEIIEYKG